MFNTYDSTRPYDNQMGYLETVLDRFWSKVKFEYNEDGTINNNACMIWTAGKNQYDYGDFCYVTHKHILAHRFSLSCYIGPLPVWEAPDWLCVRHKNSCNNRACVNPLHLEIGTQRQNIEDMIELGSQAKGSNIGSSVLCDNQVLETIKLINLGESNLDIADKFSVSEFTIRDIRYGNTWSHLTGIKHIPSGYSIGENNASAKLNDSNIREIRQKLKLGRTGVSLAREYGVSIATISLIKNNKKWTHVI